MLDVLGECVGYGWKQWLLVFGFSVGLGVYLEVRKVQETPEAAAEPYFCLRTLAVLSLLLSTLSESGPGNLL